MTETWAILLAEGDGGFWELIPIVIFIVISAVGGIIQKVTKERQERRKAEELQLKRRAAREVAQTPPPPPQQTSKQKARTIGSRIQPQSDGLQSAPLPSRQQQQQPPQLLRQAKPKPVPQVGTLRQSLSKEEVRRKQQELKRKKRLAARKSPEANTAAIESRLIHVHPKTQQPQAAVAKTDAPLSMMDLKTPDSLAKAIICHEIFSPPKALHEGREMWDTE